MCFESGTLVATPGGARDGLRKLKAGDHVLAYNIAQESVVETHVRKCHSRVVGEIYDLHIGDEVIHVTGEHPFYAVGRGWTRVADLKRGDLFLTSGKKRIEVGEIVPVSRDVRVYNLSVHGEENYFVGASQVLAHNKPP